MQPHAIDVENAAGRARTLAEIPVASQQKSYAADFHRSVNVKCVSSCAVFRYFFDRLSRAAMQDSTVLRRQLTPPFDSD
jgi:hypothetical protein